MTAFTTVTITRIDRTPDIDLDAWVELSGHFRTTDSTGEVTDLRFHREAASTSDDLWIEHPDVGDFHHVIDEDRDDEVRVAGDVLFTGDDWRSMVRDLATELRGHETDAATVARDAWANYWVDLAVSAERRAAEVA